MKRFAQIAAVAGALSMLVGFVVYSQQRAVQPDDYFKVAPAGTSTNPVTQPALAPAVAPGSKSQAPLIQHPAPATSTVRATPAPPAGFAIRAAPSSKSGVLITPEQLSLAGPQMFSPYPTGYSSLPEQRFLPTRPVMVSTKSAPVITPSTFINQRAVVTVTNPPPRRVAP